MDTLHHSQATHTKSLYAQLDVKHTATPTMGDTKHRHCQTLEKNLQILSMKNAVEVIQLM